MKLKLYAAAALLLVSACRTQAPESAVKAGGERVGHLKGYNAVKKDLRQRVYAADAAPDLDVAWLLDASSDPGVLTGFRALLGGFASTTSHAEFQNGTPNAVNMLLWDLVLSRFADSLATACDPAPLSPPAGSVFLRSLVGESRELKLKASFHQKLAAACNLPAGDAERRAVMQKLWTALMGYEAPAAEFGAWYDAFGAPGTLPAADAHERLRAMLRGLLLNPHFLLEA